MHGSDRRLEYVERMYVALLWLYPRRFRMRFGPDMAQVFRDCCDDQLRVGGNRGLIVFCLHTVKDLLVSVPHVVMQAFIRCIDVNHPIFGLVDLTLIPTIIVTNLIVLGEVVAILIRGVPENAIALNEFMLTAGSFSLVFGMLGVSSSLIIARLRPTVRLWVKLS